MRLEKLAELVELARHLASSAEGLTLDEMAQVAGVSRRTAERMRDALGQVFPQLEEVPDPPTKRFRIPNGLDGFSQAPTTEELLELSKAAAQLRAAGALPRAAVLECLERKVRAATKAKALRKLAPDVEALVRAEAIAVQAGPRPFEDENLIGHLRHALTAMKAVSFRYMGGRTPGERRTVIPFGLMFSRMNYLVAGEVGALQPRNWRLDRIAEIEVLDEPGVPPSQFSLQDYAARSFGIYQDDVEDVVLRITGEGVEDALRWRFHPTQDVHQESDGSVIVRFAASGMLELSWHLFTWGDKLEVLRPQRLRDVMVKQLETALARHRQFPSQDPLASGALSEV
ncbi:helix-turn-helix transcriptional regulator [Phenylobacterium sp.]|uniref:helix-turn-helix transcriptional regulator n=1 Tax=Phenylobacterium sp. TaxID=1871053 RepID=UPI0035B2F9EF